MKMAKKRLFIVAGTFTTAISAALIKQLNTPNCENYLVSIAPTLYENVDVHIKNEAQRLEIFKEIWFYFDFCAPKSKFKEEKPHVLSFNVQKFKAATGNIEFDEIFSVYIHGAANHLFNQYPKADLYFMEDGTAAYLKMDNASKINKRAKKIYTLNYFNKIKPFVATHEGVKPVTIDKNLVKEVFEKIASQVNAKFDRKQKSVIFCAQNISINQKAMKYDDELNLYKRNIENLLKKGYLVYFKEHPKTPLMFFNNLKKQITDPNFVNLDSFNILPVEVLVPMISPVAVVSMFSSALFTVPWIFSIPAFTFFMDKEFINHEIFGIAHLLVAHYIPSIDLVDEKPDITKQNFNFFIEKTLPLERQTIYSIKLIDYFKLFISKRQFNKLQKDFKKCHKFLLNYANLRNEVVDLFLNQSYLSFLLYYAEDYQKQYKKYLESKKKKKSSLKDTLNFIKEGLAIIFKLVL